MNQYKKPDKNRIKAVFNHVKPDRIPNFEVLVDNPTVHCIMGRDIPGGHTLANINPYDYIEFVNKIGQDVIGMCFYDQPFKYVGEDGRIRPVDFKICGRADLDRILPFNLDHLDEKFRLLDLYEEAVKNTDIGLFVLTGDFFTSAYDKLFGFENFMCMIHDERDLIEEVLEMSTIFHTALVERLVKNDLTFFYAGDDIAFKSTTLINPDLLREIWLPRMERILKPAREKGIPILYHSDGNIINVIPDLIDIGVNAINPVEPYGMDIGEVKKLFGKNLAIVGNLDVGGALSLGTPEEVKKEAEKLIDDVGRDGGLVLASSHSITKNVKPENFLAMVETAQSYGILS